MQSCDVDDISDEEEEIIPQRTAPSTPRGDSCWASTGAVSINEFLGGIMEKIDQDQQASQSTESNTTDEETDDEGCAIISEILDWRKMRERAESS